MAKVFRPIRGKKADILQMIGRSGQDGDVYFAIDTGVIYLLKDGQTYTFGGGSGSGGGGTSFIWANAEEDESLFVIEDEDGEATSEYKMLVTAIEGSTLEDPIYPDPGLMVINSDGRFFRVTGDEAANNFVLLHLIAVSGSGEGGGGTTPSAPDLDLTWSGIDLLGGTFIHGKDSKITFYPKSTADEVCSLTITVTNLANEEVFKREFKRVRSGAKCEINAQDFPATESIINGEKDELTLTALVISDHSTYNRGKGLKKTFTPIKVYKMHIDKPTDLDMIGIQTGAAKLSYIPYFAGLGTTQSPVKVFYSVDEADGILGTALIADNDQHKQYIDIPHQPHGMHIISLWLAVEMNGETYTSESISYEVPFVDINNDDPIIWIQEELGTIVQYEPAVVKYMVYSYTSEQSGSKLEVQFLQDSVLFDTAEVEYGTRWYTLDLTSKYAPGDNHFSIVCGGARKDIDFTITSDGARNLSLEHEQELELSFDSMGRSNKQIKSNRTRWIAEGRHQYNEDAYEAQMNNFNWYNNGWLDDNDGNGSYLSVSNNASVSIPMSGTINVNTPGQPWTFEIRFRTKNAKKFASLVTEVPLYVWEDSEGNECPSGSEKTLEEIAEIEGAQPVRDKDGNLVMNEANTTRKIAHSEKYVAFKYLNNGKKGFAIGAQEAYFDVGGRVVNVKYSEGEIINISFVVDKSKNQLSIYLNGILSGVGDLSGIEGFTMPAVPFTISSEYCDFDLFKFRVYPIALSMPEVIHNYIADMKNVDIYDENQLADPNDDTKLSYNKLLEYNALHPDTPTMPYVVIDMSGQTSSGNSELPYAKTAKGIDGTRIEFTNPTADRLLARGEITPWTYYTHCPSYTADNVNINVQGTSSQIYPRRNFKTKFKKAKNWNFSAGPLAGKSVNAAYYFNADGTFAESVQTQVDRINAEVEEGTKDKTTAKAEIKSLTTGLKILSKKWHMDSETLSTNKFTWKVDYMESSGSYNTGFANLMGSGVYNHHPLDDLDYLSDVNTDDYRTSVYGFPMLAFHKTDENTYTYIGRYNNNLDKSSNEYYGFELENEVPYLTYTKDVLDDNGTPTGEIESYHPTIAEIAECWELRDNQGTWCSFRYPEEMRAAGFNAQMAGATPENPRIEVAQHFESRYNMYGDQFEWGQNVIIGKENSEDYSKDVGSDNATICSYLLDKLRNLQVVFNWLDSTDQHSATNEPLSNVIGESSITYRVNGEITDPDEAAAQGVSYSSQTINNVSVRMGTFTKDSIEYRRQKFYNEFERHWNLHYCAVYFVMTELLLCYDSRGKNMMIASWGPQRQGGDYIWYPIFYDIDTQLGLNNVGAKLWDYDEDCTENGTFSTAQSVLWENFFDLYKNTIISTYRELRGGGEQATLSYKNIEGAYTCDPNVFTNSIAMRGRRPTLAIGLDEYYKYVLPITQAWRNQEGNMITANYLYACQGDRKLSRELLINNRLLYMDSKWLGGSFTISTGGMAGIMFRSTANHAGSTSDKYVEGQVTQQNQEYATYPVPYFDATPEYLVTPYLNFYITTFVDENTYQSDEAYDEERYPHGMKTKCESSVIEAYRSLRVDQQLNYFAGSSYISSLGDLSTKYANQVKIPNATHLLDITLGSDVPGYFNGETLNPFELYTEVDDNTGLIKEGCEKPLLQKMILTGLTGLNTFLDVRSPQKLTEFRALNTSLTYALFAEGAPLTTVHLPSSVTRLIFIQNKNLTRLLDSTPVILDMVNGEAVYRDPDTYKGLFVDGLTNYTISDTVDLHDGVGSAIGEIDFEGDSLGYDSYVLLKKLVAKKNGSGRENQLKIKMTDVKWTPYTQVEYGEAKDDNITYYYLTDHSTYELYDAPLSDWADDTLNGKVFTYDSTLPKNTIEDLKLLEIFRADYSAATGNQVNQFVNNVASMMNQKTYPTLTGDIFVANANGAAISETQISEVYGKIWPDLTIRAENIEKSYLTKYVEIDPNSGKEIVLDANKFSDTNGITLTDKKVPSRMHYDFLGFSPDRPGTSNPVIYVQRNTTANVWELTAAGEEAVIDSTSKVMVLYAIFVPHPYRTTFDFNNGSPIVVTETPWSSSIGLNVPAAVPSKVYPVADTATVPGTQYMGLERMYKFVGWVATGDQTETVVNLALLKPDRDRSFYALYEDVNVHSNPLSEDYFTLTPQGLQLKSDRILSGKITIPNKINNESYTAILSLVGNSNNTITHIFFEDPATNSLIRIGANACAEMSDLVYFEMPPSVTTIREGAFNSCTSLGSTDDAAGSLMKQMIENIELFDGSCFIWCSGIKVLDFGSKNHTFNASSFAAQEYLEKIIFGNAAEPSQQLASSINNEPFGGITGEANGGRGIVQIYSTAASEIYDALGVSGKAYWTLEPIS